MESIVEKVARPFSVLRKGIVSTLILMAASSVWASNIWENGAWSETVSANQDLVINISADTELLISGSAITINSIVVNGTGKLTITGARVTLTSSFTANTDVETSSDSLWFDKESKAGLTVAENKTFTFDLKQGGDVSGIKGPGKVVKKGGSDWWIQNKDGFAISGGAILDIQAGYVCLNYATVGTASIILRNNNSLCSYSDAEIAKDHTLTLEVASGSVVDMGGSYPVSFTGEGSVALRGGGRCNFTKETKFSFLPNLIATNDGSVLGIRNGVYITADGVTYADGTTYTTSEIVSYGWLIHCLNFNGDEKDYGVYELSQGGHYKNDGDSNYYVDNGNGMACKIVDGTTSQYGSGAKIKDNGDFTLVVRAKTQATANKVLFGFGQRSAGCGMRTDAEGQVQFAAWSGGSISASSSFSSVATPTTQYHTYALVYDADEHKMTFCADGAVVGGVVSYELSLSGAQYQLGSIHSGNFGNIGTGATDIYLDDLRVYSKALTLSQLKTIYAHDANPVTGYSASVSTDVNWDDIVWTETSSGEAISLTISGDRTITLSEDIFVHDISINGSVIMSASSTQTLTVADDIVLTTDASSLTIADDLTLEADVATSVPGKCVKKVVAGGSTTYTVVEAVAQIGEVKYDSLANAVAAAVNGNTITLLANCSESINLDGKSITFEEGSYTFTGKFTGVGTLTLTTWLKSAAAERWATGWEGTVVIPAFTVDQVIELNKYGILGSTVRVMGGTVGWISSVVVNPTIELGADWSLPYFSENWPNTFTKLTGSYKFTLAKTSAVNLSQNSYSPYFLIKDASEFTGSLETHTVGIVIGRNDKPTDKTHGGKILVYGTDARTSSSATWAADSGIVVNGTLTVAGTLSSATTVSDGGTMVVDGASAGVDGMLTFDGGATISFVDEVSRLAATSVTLPASGAVALNFGTGYDLPDIGDAAITLLTTETTGLNLGKFAFNESIAGLYYLTQDGSGCVTLSHAKARIGATPYAEVADALSDMFDETDHNVVVQVLDGSYDPESYEYRSSLPTYGIFWNGTAKTYEFGEASIGGTYYQTIDAALGVGGTVKLNRNATSNPVLPAGVSLNLNGYTLTGTVTATAGCVPSKRIVDGKVVYTADEDTVGESWTGAGGNTNWTNPENWSLGFVPVQNTPVTFPEGTHTVGLTANNSGDLNKCASLMLNGDVTLQRGINNWVALYLQGTDGVSGSGTLTLNQACMYNASGSALEISSPLIVSGSNDSAMLGGAWMISGAVTVNGYFKCEVPVTVTGNAAFADGAKVQTQGTMTFSGTATLNGMLYRNTSYGDSTLTFCNVVVAAVSSINGTKPTAFTGTVTLNNGATLTIPNSGTTVSGATFETPVPDSYVKRVADGSTYVYSIDAYKVISASAPHASLNRTDINGNSVMADTTITFTVTPAMFYSISSVTATSGGETITLSAIDGVYSYTVTDDVTISAATSCTGVEVEWMLE